MFPQFVIILIDCCFLSYFVDSVTVFLCFLYGFSVRLVFHAGVIWVDVSRGADGGIFFVVYSQPYRKTNAAFCQRCTEHKHDTMIQTVGNLAPFWKLRIEGSFASVVECSFLPFWTLTKLLIEILNYLLFIYFQSCWQHCTWNISIAILWCIRLKASSTHEY